VACLVHHLTPLPTIIQTCSLSARGLLTKMFVLVVTQFCTPHFFPPATDTTLLSSCILAARLYPFLYFLPISVSAFPAPFTSPWWWRQQDPLKHWYLTTTLHGVTTHKTFSWTISIFFRTNLTSDWLFLHKDITWLFNIQLPEILWMSYWTLNIVVNHLQS
jgi:hypothetical protein